MKHDLIMDGFAYRLRPISDADAPFVLALRCNPELNRYLHPTSQNLTDMLDWLASYYERSGDYYFVVERLGSGTVEGVISLYNIDFQSACGEWGRWILKQNSFAAVESAWLIYRCAFEKLGLERVICYTVADNSSVVSFHDSCGLTNRQLVPGHCYLDGKLMDAVKHQVDIQSWGNIGPRLEKLAQMTARRLLRG